ncbi:biliverdin-producing heme oxygenase [Larkinella sp. GY13]|uniref:biliverdin-producing heme oxygenase n=1 Tax=Larkinella sp. GY13 TaxID=3453720 RepID=UPI003EEA2579
MMTIAERLRHETRALHEQTEALLYNDPLRTGTMNPEQYRHLLRAHWTFHQALETAIDQNFAFFQSYDQNDRRKTPWLEADLAELNMPVPDSKPDLFKQWLPLDLLGAAYVGEGSMLGGKAVMHYLQKSPELQPLLTNARFYRGYGAEALNKWKAFGAILAAQNEADHDRIIEAAQRAFLTYHDIFRHTQPQHQAVA